MSGDDGQGLGERLTVAQAAKHAGVKPATWRSYVNRGQAPVPDGHHDRRTPWWYAGTVKTWVASRPGSGARRDLLR